jgi:hemerythrin superfamily protein
MATRQPEILAMIKEDHEKVKILFRDFEQTATSSSRQVGAISQQILDELSLHAELEEQIIYPLLQEQYPELFYQAQEEHHVAKVLISELEQMKPDDPSFQAKMLVLRTNVEHHIGEEESEIFDKVRQLASRRLTQAAETWEAQKAAAMRGRGAR